MYEILEEQEEIFWPQDKRLNSFMNSTRKSSDDPLTFLSELWKKSKFCRVYTVIDGVECNKCKEKVNVNPNDENAPEKYVLQVFFKGVNHNEFCAYITEILGRTGAKSSFKEINKLWLQFRASTRLEYTNSNNLKIKKAETIKKPRQSDYCNTCSL